MNTKPRFSIKAPNLPQLMRQVVINNWVITIAFFLLSFMAAVLVWWKCVYNETPRPQVVSAFNQSQEDFEQMSRKVDGAIKKLQQRKEEFDQAGNFSQQREIFRTKNPETSGTSQPRTAPKNNPASKDAGSESRVQ